MKERRRWLAALRSWLAGSWWRLGYALRALVGALTGGCPIALGATISWNQWMGGPERSLAVVREGVPDPKEFREVWRRPIGSGYAGLSVEGGRAVTAMTDGREDVLVMMSAVDGAERWRLPVGRTKKRGEGVPPGPLSTPAMDQDSVYFQSLGGRFVCVDAESGTLRWEASLKRDLGAWEPGYGFANSPLLVGERVILLPAGSRTHSMAALDRKTGRVVWSVACGASAEYASPTRAVFGTGFQIVAQLDTKLVGVSEVDGRKLWEVDGVGGGLWTPSLLSGGLVLFPAAEQISVRQVVEAGALEVWRSPVFGSAMGPIVEIQGLLVGHHDRRLTAVDARTGAMAWARDEETDGQLIVVGRRIVFVNDRAGRLEILSVDRTGSRVEHQQAVMASTRMETPLSYAEGRLFIRAPKEIVALDSESAPVP